MRVVTNKDFIKKRIRFTQRGSLIGLGLLVVSFVLSMTERNILFAWGLLLAGSIIAMSAARLGNRYVRPPRPDEVLDKLLKGLDNKYVLYHYYHPAEHLLQTPSGLIAIQAQEQRGKITVRNRHWRHGPFWQRLRVLAGEMGLGNPARRLRSILAAISRGAQGVEGKDGAIPVEGIIVFYKGKVELDVQDPEFPVVGVEDLKETIRQMAEAHPPLPGRSRQALTAVLHGDEPVAKAAEAPTEA